MTAIWRASIAIGALLCALVVAHVAAAQDDAVPLNVLNTITEASYTASQTEADQSTKFFQRRAATTRLSASVISALAEYPHHAAQILRTAIAAAPRHRNYIAKVVGYAFPGYRQLALNEAYAVHPAASRSPKPMTVSQSAAVSVAREQHAVEFKPILKEKFGLIAFVIGGGGHDVGAFGRRKESGKDLNLELRFSPFKGWLWDFLHNPEPHIGGHFNTGGNTNQVFVGGTWMFDFGRDFLAGGGLSLAIHDGETDTHLLDRKELGLPILFRESLEFGYRLDQHNRITLHLDHISNAGIDKNNEGLDTFGLRYTYRI